MSVGIEALLTDDPAQAMAYAVQLDELNKERKQVEQSMQQDALGIVDKLSVEEQSDQTIYVLHDESWHQGVVGLVSSRIKEKLNRPVIALAPGDAEGEWKGSARSVEGIHIRDLLARVDAIRPGLMTKFGGHAMAAGMSVKANKLPEFIRVVTEVSNCLLYTSPSPRDLSTSRMPSSA